MERSNNDMPTSAGERTKAVSAASCSIEKTIRQRSQSMKLGDGGKLSMDLGVISTGSSLDLAMGIGGLPRGRITESTGLSLR
jgi:recombination protein RecA